MVKKVQASPEAVAKAYFEWTGWNDLWADGMWEELSEETREERTRRMKESIDHANGSE